MFCSHTFPLLWKKKKKKGVTEVLVYFLGYFVEKKKLIRNKQILCNVNTKHKIKQHELFETKSYTASSSGLKICQHLLFGVLIVACSGILCQKKKINK